jgi:NhaP-type Na+/H+ or K+/H+ antiporter
MGAWLSKHLEPTAAHFTYLIVSAFLLIYALFSSFIRNRLHLSEPPLATLVGIIFGPECLNLLSPQKWGVEDNVTQEAARLIVGLQVFTAGVELPKMYFNRHWKSVAMMLGPVMTFSWLITALFTWLVIQTKWTTALTISACLAPTDPVLAASVLAESTFSRRVPRRLRNLLSAESGCNDGVSYPFLFIGLLFLIEPTTGGAVKEWVLATVLWQCCLGLLIGLVMGHSFNRTLRFAEKYDYIDPASFLVFYFLLAIFAVGVGSTLGVDDFLVAFGAGYGFAWDGWFASKTKQTHLPNILDLFLNSSMFIYFGAIIPWSHFSAGTYTPTITPGRLIGLLILILLFRRIPIVLALKRFIPDIRTYHEALFCGHFGPMGLGALFLVIEARAQLENGTSLPEPHPPEHTKHKEAIETIWPVVCFIILGSTMVHGLSVVAISVGSHFSRKEGERAPLIGQESEGLNYMVHEGGGGESEPSVSGDDDPDPNS